jgi:hypothetical protein
MAAGIAEVGASVPVTFITQLLMLANRTAFNTAEANFNAGRLTLSDAYTAAHEAETGLADWLGSAKAVLVASFGLSWSSQWAAAGFTDHSVAIPSSIGDRIGLANNIVEFLTANPSYQVTSVGVTIDAGSDIYTAAVNGQKAIADARKALDELDTVREAARTTVLAGMSGLIKNLEAKLGPMDPRWLAFGLHKPGAYVSPAKPTGLTLTLIGSDAVQVACDAMPLATRYRWRMRVVGPGNVFHLAASTVEPLAMIQPVPPGEIVEIIVQAVNGDLQSVASDPETMAIPTVAEAAPSPAAVAPVVEESFTLPASKPNGNGKARTNGSNGNGSHAVSRLG